MKKNMKPKDLKNGYLVKFFDFNENKESYALVTECELGICIVNNNEGYLVSEFNENMQILKPKNILLTEVYGLCKTIINSDKTNPINRSLLWKNELRKIETKSNIEYELNKISNKYINKEIDNKTYHEFIYDDEENEHYLATELSMFFTNNNIIFDIIKTFAYSKHNINVEVLSVSWIENNSLFLKTYCLFTN